MKRIKSRMRAGNPASGTSSMAPGAFGKGIPPILLEGDYAEEPGDETKQLASDAAIDPVEPSSTEGSSRLLLQACDPHCLYAHSDLGSISLHSSRPLLLRVHRERASGPLAAEVQIEPQSNHWFINVPNAGATYVAELGHYDPDKSWVPIATSSPSATPHASACDDKSVQFTTMPPAAPRGFSLNRHSFKEATGRLATTIAPPRVSWIPSLSPESIKSDELGETFPEIVAAEEEWTHAQESALNQMQSLDMPGRKGISSSALFSERANPDT